MIAKLKNIWYDFIHKGEKKMPTTENTTTRKLKAEIKSQANNISALRSRISELVDEIHILNSDIARFKSEVADDIRMVIEKFEQQRK